MKKLIAIGVAGAVLALALATGVHASPSAQTTTPSPTATPAGTSTPADPVQGKKLSVVLYVDTVQGAAGKPAPPAGCAQTNMFRQGQQVVFRMWGINVKNGGIALTGKNTQSAKITIPGVADPISMSYGNHGKAPNASAFWTAAWTTNAQTPIGEVDFTLTVKTKADKKHKIKALTRRYTQAGFASTSRLQVTP